MRRIAILVTSLLLGCGSAPPAPSIAPSTAASASHADFARGEVTAGLFTATNDAWFAEDASWDPRALAAECYANALRADPTLVGFLQIEMPASAGVAARVVSASPELVQVDALVGCVLARMQRLGPTAPGRRVYLSFR